LNFYIVRGLGSHRAYIDQTVEVILENLGPNWFFNKSHLSVGTDISWKMEPSRDRTVMELPCCIHAITNYSIDFSGTGIFL